MGKDPRYEQFFEREGIRYTYIPKVPMNRINRAASLHNQARLEKPIDDDTVLNYATAKNAGAEFPAPVGYDAEGQYILIDGNHRYEADRTLDRDATDFYLINTDDRYVIEKLTRFWNFAIEGRRPSQEDALAHAVYLVTHFNKPVAEVARTANIRQKTLEAAARRQKYIQRVQALGGNIQNLPDTSLDYLGRLMDRPLKAALEARSEFALNAGQVADMVKRTLDKTSEDEQLKVINEYVKEPSIQNRREQRGSGKVVHLTIRHRFQKLITDVGRVLQQYPTLDELQITREADREQVKTLWRNLNREMESVFTRSKQRAPAGSVRQSAAKRR